MDNLSPAEKLAEDIHKRIADMPAEVEQMILDSISNDTPVGAALRQDNGVPFRNYLSAVNPNDLPMLAERLTHVDNAISHSDMIHTPDLQSLVQVVDAAVNTSEGDEVKFYETLQGVAKIIPGRNTDGTVVSRYQLYEDDGADKASLDYDVTAQIREGLTGVPTEEEKAHWTRMAKEMHPDLRNLDEITADDLPFSEAELAHQSGTESWNSEIGVAAGKLMHSLTGSSHPQEPETDEGGSVLTDRSLTQEYRDVMDGAGDATAGEDGESDDATLAGAY